MWNPFQLEGTSAQSQRLETQLSVLCFFPSGLHSVEGTVLHFNSPHDCSRTYRRSNKDHRAHDSRRLLSFRLPDAREEAVWAQRKTFTRRIIFQWETLVDALKHRVIEVAQRNVCVEDRYELRLQRLTSAIALFFFNGFPSYCAEFVFSLLNLHYVDERRLVVRMA